MRRSASEPLRLPFTGRIQAAREPRELLLRRSVVAVRAVRGAVQLDRDEREHLLESVQELVREVMSANDFDVDDLISVLFTATPDLHSEFPALAARELGLGDVPLMCTQELDITGAMPRVVRLMAHVETDKARGDIQHVYLRGAVALRRDLAQ
jgi:chorismate mutase